MVVETSPELHMDVPVASMANQMTFTAAIQGETRESELKN
jgi:hypothetical protein